MNKLCLLNEEKLIWRFNQEYQSLKFVKIGEKQIMIKAEVVV